MVVVIERSAVELAESKETSAWLLLYALSSCVVVLERSEDGIGVDKLVCNPSGRDRDGESGREISGVGVLRGSMSV